MLYSIINAHPYLASFALLVLWCGIGYLEGRFISRGFACVTWALAVLASALAVVEKSDLGPLGWGLAAAILLGGAAWIIYYYNFHAGGSNAKS
jgi:hypothetical protein